MLRIKYALYIVFILLVGCSSQHSQEFESNNFNQNKAAKTRVTLGLTYLQNGNYQQAKFNLDKALEFAPRSADVNFALAYYYQKVEELEQAEEAYQFAMALAPKNADITNSYGAFLCQNGEYAKAKKYFLKAVNTSNYISSAETYENLALCSQSAGHPEDAVQYLRSAVNHQPGRGNSLYLLAQSLIDTQQWQEARDILRRYEKVSQISPESLLMAVNIEKGSRNYAAAKDYSDMLIKVYPNHPESIALLKDKSILSRQPKKIKKTWKAAHTLKNNVKSIVEQATITDKIVNEEPTTNSRLVTSDEVTTGPVESKVVQPEALKVPSYHVVTKGENLYRISLMYNIKMQRLIEWNNLSDASAIYNGKKLIIVAPNSDE